MTTLKFISLVTWGRRRLPTWRPEVDTRHRQVFQEGRFVSRDVGGSSSVEIYIKRTIQQLLASQTS